MDDVEPLHNLALALSGNSSDADDLVQDTLEELVSAWRIRTHDEPWSFVRATLTRTFISPRRRARWRREQLGDVPERQQVRPEPTRIPSPTTGSCCKVPSPYCRHASGRPWSTTPSKA